MAKTLNTAGPRRLCPVRQHSLHTPDLIAIRAPRQVLTYRQLDHQLNAVQQQLAASGLQPGDHLASIGANSLALILLAWGCLRAGLVFCPLNPRLPRVQLHAQLQQLDAKACWLATEWRAAADGEPDQHAALPLVAECVDDVHPRCLPGWQDAREQGGRKGELEGLPCQRRGN